MAAFPRAIALALLLIACTGGDAAGPLVDPAGTTTSPVSASADGIVRTPALPAYTVHLRGDASGRDWQGWEEVSFTNADTAPLDLVWLRLWSNGLDGCDPTAITISDPSSGSFRAPTVGCTAVRVDLDAPLGSGERMTLRFDLRISVPERNDRFGAAHGMSLLGTALPTLAVHDDHGWHLDPFVAFGESFYSIVGSYRVTLDVPKDLATPTTGSSETVRSVGDRELRTFVTQESRDFEWAAGPFRMLSAHADDILVRVWYLPDVVPEPEASRMLRVAQTAMTTFGSAFGAYPYPEIDVVLTRFRRYGGMEYPQIVFVDPRATFVTHELAHQWWFGIVGNDEYAEPWLDESLATWSMFLPVRPWLSCDEPAWPSSTARITNDMTYWSEHEREYGTIYRSGGCMFADLAHRFGLARWEEILAGYADANRLGVARAGDLIGAIDRAAAVDLPDLDMAAYWYRWRVG
jgi:Peptidase family M1 domain